MVEVRWSLRAIADIRGITAYIAHFDAVAAQNTGKRLYALGESLRDFPRRGRPAMDGTREMVTVPPYVLHYEVTDDGVTILTIRHGRQQPR